MWNERSNLYEERNKYIYLHMLNHSLDHLLTHQSSCLTISNTNNIKKQIRKAASEGDHKKINEILSKKETKEKTKGESLVDTRDFEVRYTSS